MYKKCCWNCERLYENCPYATILLIDGERTQALPDCSLGSQECRYTLTIETRIGEYQIDYCVGKDCEHFKPSAKYLNWMKKNIKE